MFESWHLKDFSDDTLPHTLDAKNYDSFSHSDFRSKSGLNTMNIDDGASENNVSPLH